MCSLTHSLSDLFFSSLKAAESGDLDLQYGDVRTAAALLRVFFLELPVPIITPELDALFQSASRTNTQCEHVYF